MGDPPPLYLKFVTLLIQRISSENVDAGNGCFLKIKPHSINVGMGVLFVKFIKYKRYIQGIKKTGLGFYVNHVDNGVMLRIINRMFSNINRLPFLTGSKNTSFYEFHNCFSFIYTLKQYYTKKGLRLKWKDSINYRAN